MNAMFRALVSSPVLLAVNTIVVVMMLVLLVGSNLTWSGAFELIDSITKGLPVELGLLLAPIAAPLSFVVIGALLIYPAFSVRALVSFFASRKKSDGGGQVASTLASVLGKHIVVATINVLVLFPLVTGLLLVSLQTVPIDDELAVIVGILSMVGIGLFLIPLLVPIGWVMIGFIFLDYAWQTFSGLYRAIIIRSLQRSVAQGGEVSVVGHMPGSLPVQLQQRSWLPALPQPTGSQLFYGALVAVAVWVGVQVVHGQNSQEDFFLLVLVLVPLSAYLSGRSFLKRYRRWVAVVAIVLSIPVWFVFATIILGIISAVLWGSSETIAK